MTLDYLIEQLNWIRKDNEGELKISSLLQSRGFIEIRFSNGVITQIMEPVPWPVYNLKD
jgi:hypothetical protein